MPNLNEFINKDSDLPLDVEKINGRRPCSKCEKDADFYYWYETTFEMVWTCPDGHKNSYRIH